MVDIAPGNFSNGMLGTFQWRPRWNPLASVVPFTYRDGDTMLSLMEDLHTWIDKKFVPQTNEILHDFFEQVQKNLEESSTLNEEKFNNFVLQVNALVDSINNRVGPAEVQHIILTGTRPLVIDPTWPDNHLLYYEVTQGGAGGYDLTLPPNVTGSLYLNRAAGAVTRFVLYPDGEGNWSVDPLHLRVDRFQATLSPFLAPLEAQVNSALAAVTAVRVDMDSLSEQTASVEELMVTQRIEFYGANTPLRRLDLPGIITLFSAPIPMRILSVDFVAEYADIPKNANNWMGCSVRQKSGTAYNTIVRKTTAEEGMSDRTTWSYKGSNWNSLYQNLKVGDSLLLEFSFGGDAALQLPMGVTVRYMPL